MSVFDAEVFASSVMAPIVVGNLPEKTKSLVSEMANDIEATLAALEIERDARRCQGLRDDLEDFMPKRKAEILNASIFDMGQEEFRKLERDLELIVHATVSASRAFVSSHGL